MPLDLKKLENRVDLADGLTRARCPACAEKGQDKKGEHLRIYPDGRFGCCVFSRDREHRKRIFALAGERSRQGIKVRVASAKTTAPVEPGILGRLGRLFLIPASSPAVRDAGDGGNEVQPRCSEWQPSGTSGTAVAKFNHDLAKQECLPLVETDDSGTPGTGFENPRVYVEKVPLEEEDHVYTLKGFGRGVPGVPERSEMKQAPEAAGQPGRMPCFTPGGSLVIPFDAPERYHWWKGGQTIAQTRAEVLARKENDGSPF